MTSRSETDRQVVFRSDWFYYMLTGSLNSDIQFMMVQHTPHSHELFAEKKFFFHFVFVDIVCPEFLPESANVNCAETRSIL